MYEKIDRHVSPSHFRREKKEKAVEGGREEAAEREKSIIFFVFNIYSTATMVLFSINLQLTEYGFRIKERKEKEEIRSPRFIFYILLYLLYLCYYFRYIYIILLINIIYYILYFINKYQLYPCMCHCLMSQR